MQFIQLHFVNWEFLNWERSLKQCLCYLHSWLHGGVCIIREGWINHKASLHPLPKSRQSFIASCQKHRPVPCLPLSSHQSSRLLKEFFSSQRHCDHEMRNDWWWLLTGKLASPLRNMPNVPCKVAVGPFSLHGITSRTDQHHHLLQNLKPFHTCWIIREIPRIQH